ncbi:MAG: hypothetical protein IJW46_01410 [Clostridia bacterium]|nr:hypothetical protein [Clostridia bacterium]
MKKISLILMLILLFALSVSLIACHTDQTTQETTTALPTTNTPTSTTESLVSVPPITKQFLLDAEIETVLPTPKMPSLLYTMAPPDTKDDLLSAVSLQGILAATSDERIVISYDKSAQNFTTVIKTYYKDTCSFKNLSSVWYYLKQHPTVVKGYILTDLGDDSVNVATSLAGILEAIIVTPENESNAKANGLTCLLDVREYDDAWLRKSEYFARLNKDITFMLSPDGIEFLRDYAIFNHAYLFTDADTSQLSLRSRVSHMNPGFTVLGWNNNCGEHGTVSVLSALNGCLIPADYAKNIATLASYPLASAHQKTKDTAASGKGKHTVCLVMSDGNNLQWVLNDFMTSSKWFSSMKRGKFPFAWGLPAAMIDIASPAFMYYYKNMKANEEYIMELSGLGYTFPSKWKDKNALATMQSKVIESMKRADMSVLEILDDVTLSQTVVDTYYQGFLKDEAILGALYIDYGNYAAYQGKIFWTNQKPLVTAKYRLWAGTDSIEDIAAAINRASTDETSEHAYTFITVHAWSGLDSDGNFVAGGNTMEAVYQLVTMLDKDVELVTPSEFLSRITENVAP